MSSVIKALKYVVAKSARTIQVDATDIHKSCGIISTYKIDQSDESNRSSLTSLKSAAESLGFDCTMLKGYWTEDGKTAEEQSIFIVAESGEAEDLLDFLAENAAKFDQEGFVYRPEGDEFTQLHLGDKIQGLGKFRQGRFGDFYSKIKGKPFTFV